MSGCEGDLSDKQQLTLGEIKHRLCDIWNEKFTDRLLLCFLRARDFDQGKAEKMLREWLIWRQQNNIDSLLEAYECPEVLRRYFPGGLCNHDRDGRPLYIMRFGNGDFAGIAQCVSIEAIVKHVTYLIEVMMADMKMQTEKLRRVVETITVIFDYDNFQLKQVYCLQVIDLVRHLMALYEKYYPEILERCLIINAPSFFPIFWKLVQPFLAENTRNKIEIFSRFHRAES
ncbi:SEC14-like protein 2 [Ixodes scapularis]